MQNNWELVSSEFLKDEKHLTGGSIVVEHNMSLWRRRVPKGWLLLLGVEGQSMQLMFYPDLEHSWINSIDDTGNETELNVRAIALDDCILVIEVENTNSSKVVKDVRFFWNDKPKPLIERSVPGNTITTGDIAPGAVATVRIDADWYGWPFRITLKWSDGSGLEKQLSFPFKLNERYEADASY